MRVSTQKGFSLIEVLFALGILTTGILAAAAVMAAGVQNLSSSPGDVIVTQKAAQAVEAVFAARDSHKLTWAQIRNVNGGTGSDGGVFIDGPHSMTPAGPDGQVNTQDDSSTVETVHAARASDTLLGIGDDGHITLSGYTREIKIRDVTGENGQLRSIEVTIVYQERQLAHRGPTRSTTFISAYS